MIPMELVNSVVLNRAIQTKLKVNRHKGSSLAMTRDSSSSIAMSLLRVCSEDRGEEVLDLPLPSPLQLVRVQLRKTIESLLFIVTFVSALPVLFFSFLIGNFFVFVFMCLFIFLY